MTIIKNVFIVRHGHAAFEGRTDFERTLKTKGIKATQNTAQFINQECKKHELKLESCISSAATRAKQTAEIICQHNEVKKISSHKLLYSTVASTWLDYISKSADENLVIVGHNPTFSQLVNILCGQDLYMLPAHCAFVALEIKPDGIIYPATLINYYSNE